MTRDMWHMVGGEHSLKISAPQLLWFGIDSTLNIFPQTMTQLMNERVNYLIMEVIVEQPWLHGVC